MVLLAAWLGLLALAGATMAPEPPQDSAAAESAVQVVRKQARWDGFAAPDALTSGGASYFVISGEVKNVSGKSIAFVKLIYELLDEDERVVASEYSYNRLAEDLRRPAIEEGKTKRSELRIPPIAPKASDEFRMLFLRGDVPRFSDWRVRILEVGQPEP